MSNDEWNWAGLVSTCTCVHNQMSLFHWGRVTHICVSKLTINGSDNGFSPSRRPAIIWTSAGKLLMWPLGTNFSEILIEIHAFSFKKNTLQYVVRKMAAILSRPQFVEILYSVNEILKQVLLPVMECLLGLCNLIYTVHVSLACYLHNRIIIDGIIRKFNRHINCKYVVLLVSKEEHMRQNANNSIILN